MRPLHKSDQSLETEDPEKAIKEKRRLPYEVFSEPRRQRRFAQANTERARFELARPFSLPAFQASALDQAMRPLHDLPVNVPRGTVSVYRSPFPVHRSPRAKRARVYVFLINRSRSEANRVFTRDKVAEPSEKGSARWRPENFQEDRAQSLQARARNRLACERIRVFWSRRSCSEYSFSAPENP